MAVGAHGQLIAVLPMLDTVVAHKVNIDETSEHEVTLHEIQTLLGMVIATNCGQSNKECWQ